MKRIEIADWAVNEALQKGAQAARAELSCIDMLNVQCEDAEVSTLQQNSGCGLVLRLFVDGRFGTFSTNRLDHTEISALIANGIACTRLLSIDADRTLPDPSRYYRSESLEANRQESLALESYLENDPTLDPVQLALSIGQPVLGSDPRLISFTTQFGTRSGWQYVADSQGFRGISFCSNAYAYSSASLHDEGDSRPSDGWLETGIGYADLLPLLPDLGRKALQAAQWRLGAGPVKPGLYHLAIEPVCLMKLLDPLLDAMSGFNLYAHRSFLAGKLGQQIASSSFTLTEEPQRKGAFGACLYDLEGVRTQFTELIKKGCLQTWFLSTYYARKLQMEPTLSSSNVLCIEPGTRSRQAILNDCPEAILITGFLGGNCNELTGDFSFGIEGQLFRYGERVQGVSGMNITGNMLQLWQSVSEIADDVERTFDGFFPTVFFEMISLQ